MTSIVLDPAIAELPPLPPGVVIPDTAADLYAEEEENGWMEWVLLGPGGVDRIPARVIGGVPRRPYAKRPVETVSRRYVSLVLTDLYYNCEPHWAMLPAWRGHALVSLGSLTILGGALILSYGGGEGR